MERLSRELFQHLTQRSILGMLPSRLAIFRIADERPCACGHVHAHLVHATGQQLTLHQRQRATRSFDLVAPREPGQARESAAWRRNHASPIVWLPT